MTIFFNLSSITRQQVYYVKEDKDRNERRIPCVLTGKGKGPTLDLLCHLSKIRLGSVA